jgi:opacity protein-like surface antigen
MLARKSSLFSGVALGLLMSGQALAADLPIPPIIEHTPDYSPAIGGGWYLRGDIGYGIYNDPDVTYGVNGAAQVHFFDNELSEVAVLGIGAGYVFNEFFRADITATMRTQSDFHGKTPLTGGCNPATYCSDEYADLTSYDFMVNAYIDMGTWYGITPYVGAGIGAGWTHIEGWRSVSAPGNPFAQTTTIVDNDEWTFAWALMAGASIDVFHRTKIDVGYRYLNLGEVDTGLDTANANPAWASLDDLSVHEFRVGLRYTID